MEQMHSIGEVSRMLGVQAYRISYAIQVGQLPEASYRFLHKRCFTAADIRGIAQFFGVEINLTNNAQKGAQ
jgi:DNA-binding transcriptional MerR regulator